MSERFAGITFIDAGVKSRSYKDVSVYLQKGNKLNFVFRNNILAKIFEKDNGTRVILGRTENRIYFVGSSEKGYVPNKNGTRENKYITVTLVKMPDGKKFINDYDLKYDAENRAYYIEKENSYEV